MSCILSILNIAQIGNLNFIIDDGITSYYCSDYNFLKRRKSTIRALGQAPTECLRYIHNIKVVAENEQIVVSEKIKQNSPFYKKEVRPSYLSADLIFSNKNNQKTIIDVKTNEVLWQGFTNYKDSISLGWLKFTIKLILWYTIIYLALYPSRAFVLKQKRNKKDRESLEIAISKLGVGLIESPIEEIIKIHKRTKCSETKARSKELLKNFAKQIS